VDDLPGALSAIYFFYDPDEAPPLARHLERAQRSGPMPSNGASRTFIWDIMWLVPVDGLQDRFVPSKSWDRRPLADFRHNRCVTRVLTLEQGPRAPWGGRLSLHTGRQPLRLTRPFVELCERCRPYRVEASGFHSLNHS